MLHEITPHGPGTGFIYVGFAASLVGWLYVPIAVWRRRRDSDKLRPRIPYLKIAIAAFIVTAFTFAVAAATDYAGVVALSIWMGFPYALLFVNVLGETVGFPIGVFIAWMGISIIAWRIAVAIRSTMPSAST